MNPLGRRWMPRWTRERWADWRVRHVWRLHRAARRSTIFQLRVPHKWFTRKATQSNLFCLCSLAVVMLSPSRGGADPVDSMQTLPYEVMDTPFSSYDSIVIEDDEEEPASGSKWVSFLTFNGVNMQLNSKWGSKIKFEKKNLTGAVLSEVIGSWCTDVWYSPGSSSHSSISTRGSTSSWRLISGWPTCCSKCWSHSCRKQGWLGSGPSGGRTWNLKPQTIIHINTMTK